jgi:hypothetical protein
VAPELAKPFYERYAKPYLSSREARVLGPLVEMGKQGIQENNPELVERSFDAIRALPGFSITKMDILRRYGRMGIRSLEYRQELDKQIKAGNLDEEDLFYWDLERMPDAPDAQAQQVLTAAQQFMVQAMRLTAGDGFATRYSDTLPKGDLKGPRRL